MTTITQLRNIETSAIIVINAADSKLAQFRDAAAAGFTGGQSSYRNMVNGKTAMVKGWVLEEIEEVQILKVAEFNAVSILEELNVDVIKEAKTETYGTVVGQYGRTQINPLQNGKFSIMFFPKKDVDANMVCSLVGRGDVKTQYTKFGKVNRTELNELLATLA
ncbi:hypothetical protein NVP1244A_159 [Vibrio phage 1.244.A._10N.261.54.C3]|nr:hypothetical protein NVP1244A_159 [Vibrio phage 1.244.A._10N.261.54.C3]AUR98787.1 hypothetical protein NVP1255O_159 [Vibrio phage 1.255.O._10N.286.45.F1]